MAALTEQPPLKICEFYSGIGGWRYALEKATSREDHDVALDLGVRLLSDRVEVALVVKN